MQHTILSQKKYISFREDLRLFLKKEITPYVTLWEKSRYFPNDILKKMAERGFIGLSLSEKNSGKGKDFWYEVILAEELGKSGTLGIALSLLLHTNGVAPLIEELCSISQGKEILAPALRGEYYFALAATEPQSGSDLNATELTATQEGESYILNGEKRYITNGSIAKYIVTLARTLGGNGIWSLGLFLVPSDAPGFSAQILETSGFKTGNTASLSFEKCVIPKENILGDSKKGFYFLLKGLQRERLIGAVLLNAVGEEVIRRTTEFLQGRKRFGEALSKKQVIRHRLVEMSTELEASKQFTYSVCEGFAKGESVDKEIVMLKILSYETCQRIIDECAHLHGAEAFLEDHWLSFLSRDAKAFTLAAGTTEVMKDVLSGMLRI